MQTDTIRPVPIIDRFLLTYLHPGTPSGALALGALFLVIGVLVTLLIRLAAGRALQRGVDPTPVIILRPVAQIVLWVVLLVSYAHIVPALRAFGTALLAGASVASIVLGVAAQNTLGNAIAGMALLIYRPFRIGDRLQVLAPTGLETGNVETITLGYTVLQTFDNRRVVIPNSQIGNQTTINLTSVDPRVLAAVPFGVSYTTDLSKARAILLELANGHPDVLSVHSCPVIQLASSSVLLSLRAWCHDPGAARRFEYDLYERAKARFDAAAIEIPYPYQNVVLRPLGPDAPAPTPTV